MSASTTRTASAEHLHALMLTLNGARMIAALPRALLGPGRRTTTKNASYEPVAHRLAVLAHGRSVGHRFVQGRGDFRMAAASTVVFADALPGRDGGAPIAPGVWYPEEALSLGRVGQALASEGVTVTDWPGRPGVVIVMPFAIPAHPKHRSSRPTRRCPPSLGGRRGGRP